MAYKFYATIATNVRHKMKGQDVVENKDNITVLYDANQLIDSLAEELIFLYFEHTDDHDVTSTEGLEAMEDFMEDVALPLRGSVFGVFLSKLQAAGIKYDVESFQHTHH